MAYHRLRLPLALIITYPHQGHGLIHGYPISKYLMLQVGLGFIFLPCYWALNKLATRAEFLQCYATLNQTAKFGFLCSEHKERHFPVWFERIKTSLFIPLS